MPGLVVLLMATIADADANVYADADGDVTLAVGRVELVRL